MNEETKEETIPSIPPLSFPLFFATSLSEMSQPFFNLASMQHISNNSTPLLTAFSEVNTKTDYRCVLLCTSLISSQIPSSFDFEGNKNKNEVFFALAKAICLEPSLVCYSEESLESDRKRRDDSTQLSLYDCMELKKTSSVLLTGSKYHPPIVRYEIAHVSNATIPIHSKPHRSYRVFLRFSSFN